MIAPVDASADVRKSIQQIIDEVHQLQRKLASVGKSDAGVSKKEFDEYKRSMAFLLGHPNSLDFNDTFRGSGPAHSIGYVPDPGATPGTSKYLREDASWQVVDIAGALAARSVIAGSGLAGGGTLDADRTLDVDITELSASASPPDQDSDYMLLYSGGNKKITPSLISGAQPHCIRYSSGQGNSGSGETALTSYDWTAPAGFLGIGDTLNIAGLAFLPTAYGGSKTLRLYIGTSAAVQIVTTAVTTAFTLMYFNLNLWVRAVTTISVTGLCTITTAGTVSALNMVNAGASVSDVSANSQLFRLTAQANFDDYIKMTDYAIRVFRAGGNSTLV